LNTAATTAATATGTPGVAAPTSTSLPPPPKLPPEKKMQSERLLDFAGELDAEIETADKAKVVELLCACRRELVHVLSELADMRSRAERAEQAQREAEADPPDAKTRTERAERVAADAQRFSSETNDRCLRLETDLDNERARGAVAQRALRKIQDEKRSLEDQIRDGNVHSDYEQIRKDRDQLLEEVQTMTKKLAAADDATRHLATELRDAKRCRTGTPTTDARRPTPGGAAGGPSLKSLACSTTSTGSRTSPVRRGSAGTSSPGPSPSTSPLPRRGPGPHASPQSSSIAISPAVSPVSVRTEAAMSPIRFSSAGGVPTVAEQQRTELTRASSEQQLSRTGSEQQLVHRGRLLVTRREERQRVRTAAQTTQATGGSRGKTQSACSSPQTGYRTVLEGAGSAPSSPGPANRACWSDLAPVRRAASGSYAVIGPSVSTLGGPISRTTSPLARGDRADKERPRVERAVAGIPSNGHCRSGEEEGAGFSGRSRSTGPSVEAVAAEVAAAVADVGLGPARAPCAFLSPPPAAAKGQDAPPLQIAAPPHIVSACASRGSSRGACAGTSKSPRTSRSPRTSKSPRRAPTLRFEEEEEGDEEDCQVVFGMSPLARSSPSRCGAEDLSLSISRLS